MRARTLIHILFTGLVMLAFQNCGKQEFGSAPQADLVSAGEPDPGTTGPADPGSHGATPPAGTGGGTTGGTTGGTNHGSVSGGGTTTTPPKPAYCTDYYLAYMCDIYKYLYNRWPDEAGARYWVRDFTNARVPYDCYTRRVAIGTQPADCERHRAKWGFYPDNGGLCPAGRRGHAPAAAPTAQCANVAP